MTETEAILINTVIRWMIDDPNITTAQAYDCAADLAEVTHAALSTGVTALSGPVSARQVWAAAHNPAHPITPPSGRHRALCGLLAACWEIEDSDGGWSGGDVVSIVTEQLDSLGYNLRHPATIGVPPRDRAAWDARDLFEYARDHAHAPTAGPHSVSE